MENLSWKQLTAIGAIAATALGAAYYSIKLVCEDVVADAKVEAEVVNETAAD